ncbi:uncharacterized protein LOC130737350 [Lotus japonicus]|uniref:uncharacterized protein LOC130737350 n=1 Tax=Lotus japonicus TaxID=34305 RepID=UPI0025892826|nr:uncharacterized protein LOC130737350 [Lotus japonicus]
MGDQLSYLMQYGLCFIVLTLVVAPVHGEVEYSVLNNAESTIGGQRFDRQVGVDYAKDTMSSATEFILKLFEQHNSTSVAADRKNVQKVSMIVEISIHGDDVDDAAYCSNNEIHISASYIERYSGDIKKEIIGIMYHEMTHVWQWDGNGQAPSGLIEGIADFVRLKAGYAPLDLWVPPGGGDKWDQGYDVTARFLDYCNSIRNGFVGELNKKMKSSYSETYFTQLLGKSVTQLWTGYKANYAASAAMLSTTTLLIN